MFSWNVILSSFSNSSSFFYCYVLFLLQLLLLLHNLFVFFFLKGCEPSWRVIELHTMVRDSFSEITSTRACSG